MTKDKITLTYLELSERNLVDWAWDARDTDGVDYYITCRYGQLFVTGNDEVIIDREVGDWAWPDKAEMIAMLADRFDTSQLGETPPEETASSLWPIVYHGVKVKWTDGWTEMMRYETREQAEQAAYYQNVENWRSVKWASYVGRRIWLKKLLPWNW